MRDIIVNHKFRNDRIKEYVLHFIWYIDNLSTWATDEQCKEFRDYYPIEDQAKLVYDLCRIDEDYEFEDRLRHELRYQELALEHSTQSKDFESFLCELGVIDSRVVSRCLALRIIKKGE